MNLLELITQQDYSNVAGPQWPSYAEFLTGKYNVSLEVQQEIDQFVQDAEQIATPASQWRPGTPDKNLQLYVTKDDYIQGAGPDWPSYQDFVNGAQSTNTTLQTELTNFKQQHVAQGIKFPIKTEIGRAHV